MGGDSIFEVEDQDAVAVELAVVKASGLVDRDAELAAEPVSADALSPVASPRF